MRNLIVLVPSLVLAGCVPQSTPHSPATTPTAAQSSSSADVAPTEPSQLDADLALLARWFHGRFDNHLQVVEARAAKVEKSLIHEHIHSIFARVDLPAFGEYVFYVKQYMDGDPRKTYRQRLYTFEAAPETQEIVLRIYAFLDDAAFTDAHLDPSKLAGLTPDKTRPTPGCEVFWKREGDHFRGHTKPNACRIKSRRSGRTLIISDDLYLDEDEIWIHDRAVDEQGVLVFGHKGNVPHKLKRAREFTGWAAIRKPDAPSSAGKDAWIGVRGLLLHDQGQRVALMSDDGKALGYTIELAQLVYANTKTPVLKLAVYQDGSDKSLAYTWANPEAERIGVNLGKIQVGLTLKR